MAIVQLPTGTFYIPDEIAGNPSNTVADLQESAIPIALHNLQNAVKELKERKVELEEAFTPENIQAYIEENHPLYEQKRELLQSKQDIQSQIDEVEGQIWEIDAEAYPEKLPDYREKQMIDSYIEKAENEVKDWITNNS